MSDSIHTGILQRFWSWWQVEANKIAHAVYYDPPPPPRPVQTPSAVRRPRPLSMGERLLALLLIAAVAGVLSWQLAIDRRSAEEKAASAADDFWSNELGLKDDSWVRSNPRTFGAVVGVGVYIAGVLTIVAIEQRPKK